MMTSIQRTFHLLNLLVQHREGLTNAQMAAHLNIPKSTLSLILRSLLEIHYLSLDAPSKRYRLGPGVLSLSRSYLDNLDIVQVGRSFLRQLARKVDESCSLCILDGNDLLLVAKEDMPNPLRPFMKIGERCPIYASSASRVMIAFRSKTEIEEYLSSVAMIPITPQTITDPEKIWKEIKKARQGKPLYCREEVMNDVTAISAPVFDIRREAVAAVSIRTPSFRLNPEREKWLESELLKVTSDFSTLLGFDGRIKQTFR